MLQCQITGFYRASYIWPDPYMNRRLEAAFSAAQLYLRGLRQSARWWCST